MQNNQLSSYQLSLVVFFILYYPFITELPFVYAIKNITVKEGQAINVTCLSRGDPYPIITWLNITSNDTIPDVDRVTSNTVSVCY